MPEESALYENYINDIIQDSQGFLWFATYKGLFRFDGYEVLAFPNIPKDTSSLPLGPAQKLFIDSKGKLWVSIYGGGLCMLITGTKNFEVYRHLDKKNTSISSNKISSMVEDADGNIWVGTNDAGLNKLNKGTKFFTHYFQQFKLSPEHPLIVFKARNNLLWLASTDGIYRYDKIKNDFIKMQWKGIPSLTLYHSFYQTKNGEIILTANQGIYVINAKANSIKPLSSEFIKPNGSLGCKALYQDKNQALWLGTTGMGLYIFQPNSLKSRKYLHNNYDPNSIPDNTINCIYQDRAGNIWIGTPEGLCFTNKQQSVFKNYTWNPGLSNTISSKHIRSVYQDAEDVIWVGTEGSGLDKISKEDIVKHYNLPGYKAGGQFNMVNCIYEGSKNKIWIGSNSGLYIFDKRKNSIAGYCNRKKDNLRIWAICEDENNNIL
ncbi:MAG: hypothetical protein NTX03_08580, partial [Bacteroidetes bacterium]|nr:hypothetical protein [Bacteroidota bacterium]